MRKTEHWEAALLHRLVRVSSTLLVAAALATGSPASGGEPSLHALRTAYSAISGTQTGLWVAVEAGDFRREGLQVQLIYIAGAARVAQAMIAGDVQLATAGGEGVVAANAGGADLVYFGGIINVPAFGLVVSPRIRGVADLRGRRMGITRFGASTDFTLRYALKRWGLEPQKDVTVLQLGGQPEILAALTAGHIDGGVFAEPFTTRAVRAGNTLLRDLGKEGIEFVHLGLVTRRAFLRSQEAVVERFLKGYTRGVHRVFQDRETALRVLAKYTRATDPEALAAAYRYATSYIQRVPHPTLKGIQLVIDESPYPGARGMKAEQFVDTTVLRRLEDSGFLKQFER